MMTATFALVTLAFTIAVAPAACGDDPESPQVPGLGSPPAVKVVPGQEHVVEFADDTRMHGRVWKLTANEVVLQRTDSGEPLVFSLGEIRRIIFRAPPTAAEQKTKATLHLAGGGWIGGEVSAFEDGKFQVQIGAGASLAVPRAKVRWLGLSPTDAPDGYDGPDREFGFEGWEDGDGWELRGSWFHRGGVNAPLSKKFNLPEKVDVEISASDISPEKWGNTTLAIANEGGNPGEGGQVSSASVSMGADNLTGMLWEQRQRGGGKSLNGVIKLGADAPKITTYRFLHDRKSGSILAFVNGKKIADWKSAWTEKFFPGCTFSLQPTAPDFPLVRLRIMPWDGNPEPDATPAEAGKDLLSSGAPGRHAGSVEAITGDAVRFSGKEFSRKEAIFLRLAGGDAAVPRAASVARLHLAQRGEFDVASLEIRDGQLRLGTSFAGEVSLPVAAVRAVVFPRRDHAPGAIRDRLVFTNGDILRGSFAGTGADGAVKWRTVLGAEHEFAAAAVAGTVLAKRPEPATLAGSAAVRFRNGDWLGGDVAALDAAHLLFKVPLLGSLRIDRASVGHLYFGTAGEVPAWDGVADRDAWMKGQAAQIGSMSPSRSMWRYLDGAFFAETSDRGGESDGSTLLLGRTFSTLPEKVEVCFDARSTKGQLGVMVQLFADLRRGGGIEIQCSGGTITISEQPARQGASAREAHAELGDTFDESKPHRCRLLADRRSGQIAIFVDGKLVLTSTPRVTKDSPKRGRGLFIMPQAESLILSNLWVAPWAGTIPEMPKKKDAKEIPAPEVPPEMVALANGDETPGTVERITPDAIFLKCEIGTIELPVKRALMVDFAAKPVPPVPGVRLHLAGRGLLTVQAFSVRDGKVSCRSDVLGDLTFPIESLSEIGFLRSEKRPLAGIAPAFQAWRKPGHAPALESVKMDPAALDATPRTYDLLEFNGDGGDDKAGRMVTKTVVGKDAVTFEDEMKLRGNASAKRTTVVEKNPPLRLRQIVGETKEGRARNRQQLVVAGGKAMLRSEDSGPDDPANAVAVSSNSFTIAMLLRIVTLLPREAGGAWTIDRIFDDVNMDLGIAEPHWLECAGKETAEHGDKVRRMTRFTLRTETRARAEFFVDENGVVQWVDIEESLSPYARAMRLREERE